MRGWRRCGGPSVCCRLVVVSEHNKAAWKLHTFTDTLRVGIFELINSSFRIGSGERDVKEPVCNERKHANAL